jgi:sulfur carrier protein
MNTSDDSSQIIVNGEAHPVPDDGALTSLLRDEGIDPEEASGVAIALNDEVVRRSDWATTTLEAGDRVEIVTATQGG